jgi:hypothetical protein
MRHDKLHFCFLILFLALGVAARETPEIMDLTDDWSNDGTAVGYENPLPQLTSRRASRQERLQSNTDQTLALVNLKQRSCPIPPLVLPADAGPALLHFLSVQRN